MKAGSAIKGMLAFLLLMLIVYGFAYAIVTQNTGPPKGYKVDLGAVKWEGRQIEKGLNQ